MKNKIVIIVLVIMGLFFTGCGTKIEEEVKEEVVIEELKQEEIDYLMKFIDQLEYFDYLNKNFKVNDLSNQEVLQFTYDLFSKRGELNNIVLKNLQEYADTYLDFALEPENILCVTHFNLNVGSDYMYLYNINSDKFNRNKEHTGHSMDGFYSNVYNKYVSSKRENDYYEIVVNKAFSELVVDNMDVDMKYFKTYVDAQNKKNKIFTVTFDYQKSEYNPDPSKMLETYNGELVNYTYVFKKIDNRFVFVSYSFK